MCPRLFVPLGPLKGIAWLWRALEGSEGFTGHCAAPEGSGGFWKAWEGFRWRFLEDSGRF